MGTLAGSILKSNCAEGVAIGLANLHLKRFSSTLSTSPAEEEKGEDIFIMLVLHV